MIQTDIYYLPYYQSKTHFAGHLIAAWGYDLEKGVVLVTDTERPGLIEVPLEAMRRARYCKLPPFVMEGNLFAPERVAVPADLGARAWEAVQANSRALLNDEFFYSGMPALLTHNCIDPGQGNYTTNGASGVNLIANNCHRKSSTSDGWHILAPGQ